MSNDWSLHPEVGGGTVGSPVLVGTFEQEGVVERSSSRAN